VFGTTNDKDIAAMANSITDIADSVFATQYTTNPRALAAQQCYQAFCQATRERTRSSLTDAAAFHLVETPEAALQEALRWVNQHAIQSPAGESASPGTVIVCGSFFLAGQLRPQLLAAQADLVHSSADAAGPL
jgi:dihydrofolate synthase/folylpolyglutamate synthase